MGELVAGKEERFSCDEVISGKPEGYLAALYTGIVDLVAEYPHWGGKQRTKEHEDDIPETMLLDLLRIKALNGHFHTDVVRCPLPWSFVLFRHF